MEANVDSARQIRDVYLHPLLLSWYRDEYYHGAMKDPLYRSERLLAERLFLGE